MFKNYFKIAWRNLLHNKSFSSINIIGLSIGMTCCLIIFQYVAFEYSFDRFHEKKDQVYRVLQAYARGTDEMDQGHAFTAQALAPSLQSAVPEIINITRLHSETAVVSNVAKPDQVFEEDDMLYADPDFMKMFSFPLLSGDINKALQPGTVLLSEAAARKYFGDSQAVGQTLQVSGIVEKSYTVTGVFKETPANSHLQFEFLLPMEDLLKGDNYRDEPEGGWSWNNFTTYVELHPTADLKDVQKKMTSVLLKYRGDMLKQQGGRGALNLQPMTDIHLNSKVMGAGSNVSGSYRTVYFFLIIGLITLIIALVNYVNLATARALNRSREVGVRKAVGAKRGQLVAQFLYESALTNITAVVIALALTAALIPTVNDIAETRLSVQQWLEPGFIGALAITLLAGTLLAGLYPAFVLSSFRPATVLKGKTAHVAAHTWLRKGLVVVQFTACIVLISGTVVVYNQLNYMKGLDLGMNLEQTLAVRAPRTLAENVDLSTALSGFLNEVRRMPGVEAAAVSTSIPGMGFNWNGASIRKSADDPSKALRGVATYIDSAFAPLYGLKLIAGKEFHEITIPTADDAPWTVILNETGTKSLGYPTPAEAVGESLDIGGYNAVIVGVYKDFQWSSAHQAQQTIIFGPTTEGDQISVRLASNDFAAVVKKIQTTYDEMFPGNVFQYSFVDETFDLQYRNDQRFAKLFGIFAGMTIFIACLGLFGLVAFTAQQRTKEIGMRKVLGATVTSIVGLLSKDFLKLVIAGFVLAVPLTIYIMNQWLENFAYRTNISAGIFVVSGVVAIFIALATVSWQSFKAAIANPVNSLRSE